MSEVTNQPQFQLPTLAEGEVYVGAIFGPNGQGHHVVLLPETKNSVEWKDALEWAKDVGGDLPSRLELQLLYTYAREHFAKACYWSNEAEGNACAWYQFFYGGSQTCLSRSYGLRARAVRRLTIQ